MKKPKSDAWIPKNWTFESAAVAKRFEAHVREQLPWYEMLTASVVHIAAHYLPKYGLVYDIGASTGNTARALSPILWDRKAKLVAIEQSREMAKMFFPPHMPFDFTLLIEDALDLTYEPFDVGICLLTLMFMPVASRRSFLARLVSKLKPGGALIVVDKVLTTDAYPSVVLRRLAMKWKLDAGAKAEEIVAKELSLGGVQRPIDVRILPKNATQFFQFGEFAGWIIEAPEVE